LNITACPTDPCPQIAVRILPQASLKDNLNATKRQESFHALFRLPTNEKIGLELSAVVWTKAHGYIEGTLFVSSHLFCFYGRPQLHTIVWPLADMHAEPVRSANQTGSHEAAGAHMHVNAPFLTHDGRPRTRGSFQTASACRST